ncbi:flagellar biosynthetic protein FliO [Cohnella terricola]|uniref:Flagellar protein n=1 Tax=Cohnella terricola TaxID=1289167 RepID=A0A559JCQ1_9BACL|nr:flagellar biosynthetic protein FliO [Cohnella terricola]TVX97654.1 flagellar protein [Cohnella terricola]
MRAYGLTEDMPVSSLGSVWELIWVLFVLAVIVGLIVLVLRFVAKRNRGWGMNRSLRSLGGFPLGTNKSMQIVEWNGRIYVLGVGDDVTLLEAITEPEIVDALLAEHEINLANSGAGMPEWLRKWTQRNNPQSEELSSQQSGSGISFEKSLENRLRQLSERRQKVGHLLEENRSEDRTDER